MGAYTRDRFAAEADITPEAMKSFDTWHALLEKWNRRINLVSPAAMREFWLRHALDSWQVAMMTPRGAKQAIDLGSGAGFPGLAVAIAMKERGAGNVVLVESAGKKANFLRTTVRELGLPARVTTERAESLTAEPYDLVTARAFAPLPRLLGYAHRYWGPGTTGVFPKGEGAEAELETARSGWTFDVDILPSRTSDTGKLLAIRNLSPIAD